MVMRRVLSLVFDFIAQKIFSSPHDLGRMIAEVSQESFHQVLVTMGVVLLSSLIGVLGLITVLVDLIVHSYLGPGLHLSQVSWVGVFLIVAAYLAAQFRMTKTQAPKASRETPVELQSLQLAVAELIKDFVEERKMRRQREFDSTMESQSFSSAREPAHG